MDVLNWLIDILLDLIEWVVTLLPDSPFTVIDSTPIAPYLGYINYFVPLDFIVSTLTLWLTAITIYYIYSVFLRWVKAVE